MIRVFWLTMLMLSMCSNMLKSQIAIGKTSVDGSGLIDFKKNTTNGIILPHIHNSTNITNASPGTFVYDSTTAQIKLYDGSSWQNLTSSSASYTNNTFLKEKGNANGVVIGQSTPSSAEGILVLESNTKALILPHVTNPVTNVKSPYAGMMCYDPTTKLICIYNGENWFFWGITT